MARAFLLVAVVASTLSACGGYESQIKRLEAAIRWLQVGHSNDYWMEVKNFEGNWERVALVFGYWDDYEGCQEIIGILGKNYARHYRCVPAN